MVHSAWTRDVLVSVTLTLTLVLTSSCGKSTADAEAEAEALVETEEQAAEVAAQFRGVFRHEAEVAGTPVVTELELRDDAIQQRRNGLVVLDALCTRETQTRRRMLFECVSTDETRSRWPLEIDAQGRLFHRAMPEMRYLPIAEEAGD